MIVDRLEKAACSFLPFFHVLSGEDDTSFMYGIGKKKMWDAQKLVAHPTLDQFAEVIQDYPCQLTDVQISEAKGILVAAYGTKHQTSIADL